MIDVLPNEEEIEKSRHMLPEERLYQLMIEHVDPETYDGRRFGDCLIGQVATALGRMDPCPYPLFVGIALHVSPFLADTIFWKAAAIEYRDDLPAALSMARDVLNLDETGRRSPPVKPEDAF